jgi:hypothetical protein
MMMITTSANSISLAVCCAEQQKYFSYKTNTRFCTKIGIKRRRIMWPLCRDGTGNRVAFHVKEMALPKLRPVTAEARVRPQVSPHEILAAKK